MPMCVCVPVSPCSEGWSGLLWLQLQQPSSQQQQNGSSSSNPLGSSSRKQRSSKQQQGVIIPQDQGRRQMLPGMGTLRGERTPGF